VKLKLENALEGRVATFYFIFYFLFLFIYLGFGEAFQSLEAFCTRVVCLIVQSVVGFLFMDYFFNHVGGYSHDRNYSKSRG